MAHRWYYEQEHGPIQNGLELDHLCHNRDANCPGNECIHRRCVNPLHLEAVAHPENVRRGRASKLNPVLVAQIRSLCSQGWLQKDIAPAFGVAQGTVSKIATGRAWQEG